MDGKKTIPILLLILMLSIQPISFTVQSSQNDSSGKVYMESVIGAHRTKLEIDSNIASTIMKDISAGQIQPIIADGNYQAHIFANSSFAHIYGSFEASKLKNISPIENEYITQGSMSGLNISNLISSTSAHITYDPQLNETTATYKGEVSFNLSSNISSGKYDIDFDGTYHSINGSEEININIHITHTFEVNSTYIQTPTQLPGSAGASGVSGEQVAHTYINIEYSRYPDGGVLKSHYNITIITDDTADWAIYSMIIMMYQYQENATVTVQPSNGFPIVGIQNVTIIIEGTGEVPLLGEGITPTQENEIGNLEEPSGHTETDIELTLKYDSGKAEGEFNIVSTGDFSNGFLIYGTGTKVLYVDADVYGSIKDGKTVSSIKGIAKLAYEDPIPVFLALQDYMITSHEQLGHDGELRFVLESGSDNISFILNEKEFKHLIITTKNATLVNELKIKYGDTIAGGNRYVIEIQVDTKDQYAKVNIPSLTNQTSIIIDSTTDALVIHHPGLRAIGQELTFNITVKDSYHLVIKLRPGTALDKDISVKVFGTIPPNISIPSNAVPVGPAYELTTEVNGSILLGFQVDPDVVDKVYILWVHDGETTVLTPVSRDSATGMVYVEVSGFSTFVPIVMEATTTTPPTQPPTETTTTQQGGQQTTTGPSGSTSSTTQSQQTSETGTSTTGQPSGTSASETETSEGGGNTGLIIGVVIVIIIIAGLGLYLVRR